MNDVLKFSDSAAFRVWLDKNNAISDGIWLLFGKKSGPPTLTENEALREALCFGWIDGKIQSIDDNTYMKYFAARLPNSRCSVKNKQLVEYLNNNGK